MRTCSSVHLVQWLQGCVGGPHSAPRCLAWVPAPPPLQLQLPADVHPGSTAADCGTNSWVPAIHMESQIEFQTLGFGLAQLWM